MFSVRQPILLSAAFVGVAGSIALAVPAVAAPHYTASSCSGQTNGACYYNSGRSLQAWDRGGADNRTLKDWAYYRSSTSIGSTIVSVSIRGSSSVNCGAVNFFHAANITGAYVYVAAPGGNLPSSYQRNVGSVAWPC